MNRTELKATFLIALLIVGICGIFVPISIEDEVTREEVWVTNAPFGVYWTNTHGNILFMRTSFQESYIVKYLDENNQVHTLVMDAFEERYNKDKVFFTDDNTTMYMDCHHEYGKVVWGFKVLNSYYYELYIPKPDICPEGWYENPELIE